MTGSYWDKTWNITVGCDPVSSGCDYCFAVPTGRIRSANPNPAVAAAWAGTVTPVGTRMKWTGVVNEVRARLDDPYRWRKPTTIYLTLVGDMFHAKVSDEFLVQAFARIATTGRHTYLCTTKRHARMRSLLNNPDFRDRVVHAASQLVGVRGAQPWDGRWPLTNLHLAVSIEDQWSAGLRIPSLLDTPAAVRWVSAEPLLKRTSLCWCSRSGQHPFLGAEDCPLHGTVTLDWVVTGGESGSPRAVHPDHVRLLRDQCVDAHVPFWFKQWGDFLPLPVVDRPGMSGGRAVQRCGWHAAIIREPGPSGTMRNATTRPMRAGDRTKGGIMLDEDTFAVKVGAKAAGRELDGRTWDELPSVRAGWVPCA